MKADLTKGSDESTTRFLADSLLVCAGFFIFTCILNALDIFILDKEKYTIVSVLCCIIFFIPKASLLIRKKYENWMKYAVVTCASLAICIAYCVLTYHIVMIFSFPLIISILYFNKKFTVFTTVENAVFMTAAHIISAYTSVVYDDPLVTINQILLFGLLPRLLIFCTFSVVGIALGNKAQKAFDELKKYNMEIEHTKDSLDTIITVSRPLYSAGSITELAGLIRNAVFTVTEKIQGNSLNTPLTTIGFRKENGEFYRLDCFFKVDTINMEETDLIDVTMPNVNFSYPVIKQKVWDNIQLKSNGIGMSFYESNELLFFISMELNVNAVDNTLLKNSLNILYNNISTAISQTKVNSDMFRTQESVILSFAEISESKSHQTGQHVKRVSEYTRIMAACAGYDENMCSKIALAAMMHDIGKLMIPPEILEKKAKLTAEEFEIIKTHVTYGEELLKNSPGEVMHMARRIALQHHERWDGNGYLGYSGEKIDYISRFVAVADVFDALVSKRSYKQGWPPEEAYAEIVRQRGTQFAPHAVDIFVKSYDKILETLRQYPDEAAQSA
ncbi:MAG: HD domain-containing protein [Oscillospiraceae bacterium]|nr:HD domain-containing protein [Oscillospiraceae bacterium]